MMFTFLENALNLRSFTYVSLLCLTKNSPPSCYYYNLGRGKLLIPTDTIFFQKCVSPTSEKGRANYDLLYQNSLKKMTMTWYIGYIYFG